jgi:hypothetical protein
MPGVQSIGLPDIDATTHLLKAMQDFKAPKSTTALTSAAKSRLGNIVETRLKGSYMISIISDSQSNEVSANAYGDESALLDVILQFQWPRLQALQFG